MRLHSARTGHANDITRKIKMIRHLFAAGALLIATTGAASAENLYFTLVNTTGVNAVAFHVSESGNDEWGENLMAGGYLPSGNEIEVEIADGLDVCVYDIRTDFEDGDVLDDYGVNLCDLGTYTLQ
jgi:hypothetical protein